MHTVKRLDVPTGSILVVEGELGRLECLSLGDYGAEANVKADFLGLTRDPGVVTHRPLIPLERKWVITISTQYGCSMGCAFCDVPKVGPGRNATVRDLVDQFWTAFHLHPEVKRSDRVNLHFARMGEPTFNPDVLLATSLLRSELGGRGDFRLHPVVSTMLPNGNRDLRAFLREWCDMKNALFAGDAGLQISINSTSDAEREAMFHGNAKPLAEAAAIAARLPAPRGRKYTLNFAVAGWEIDAVRLASLFDPARFMVKLTPMHRTAAADARGISTPGDAATIAPYAAHEAALRAAGFDVLVFIASEEEDGGLVTCGNAILSGTRPRVTYKER